MVKFLLWSAVKSCQAASRKLSRRALGKSPLAMPTIRVRPGLNPACTHSSPPAAKKFPEILRPCAYCAESSSIAVNGTSKSKAFQEGHLRSGVGSCLGWKYGAGSDPLRPAPNGHFDTPLHSAVRFAIFMIGGVFMGLSMWKLSQEPRKQRSPTIVRVQFVVFVALMLGLAYMVWRSF
jgi:hypothetical protein